MFVTKHRSAKGFTLVEMLIVIIIIGVLAGTILLASGVYADKANETACLNNRKVIERAYLIGKLDDSSATLGSIVLSAISDKPGASIVYGSSDYFCTVKGACPSGGTIIIMVPDIMNISSVDVVCTKHVDELSDTFIKQISDIITLNKIEFTCPANNKIYTLDTYFANVSKKNTLDSNGSNYGQPLTKAVSEMIGIDLSNYTWKITKNGTTYDVYWSTVPASAATNNSTVQVYKYTGSTASVVEGTAKISVGKDEKQSKYYVIDSTTFTS